MQTLIHDKYVWRLWMGRPGNSVFPELDMVVVFTGGNCDANSSLYEILEEHVLPAIK